MANNSLIGTGAVGAASAAQKQNSQAVKIMICGDACGDFGRLYDFIEEK